jgi:uncharacterized protein (TIGR02246 family)
MRYLLLSILLTACTGSFQPADEAAIRTVMTDQEAAWDRGDIPGFMEGYSDTVCFIGGRGRTCGRQAVSANYQRKYPDKAAMGDLTFGIQEVMPLGSSHAWLTGTWQLVRTADTLGGGFTLLWVKEGEAWKIARDHSY